MKLLIAKEACRKIGCSAVILLGGVRRPQVRRRTDNTIFLGLCLLLSFFGSLLILLLRRSDTQIRTHSFSRPKFSSDLSNLYPNCLKHGRHGSFTVPEDALQTIKGCKVQTAETEGGTCSHCWCQPSCGCSVAQERVQCSGNNISGYLPHEPMSQITREWLYESTGCGTVDTDGK